MNRHYPFVIKWLWKNWPWLVSTLIVLLASLFTIRTLTVLSEIEYGLTPPDLPAYQPMNTQFINQTGWYDSEESIGAEWPYHASQGTATLPIPYEWLKALEAPKSSPWFILFTKEKAFLEEYIYRLGFINLNDVNEPVPFYDQQLPLGLAKTSSINLPGLDRKATAVGFTCTACHTGQFTYQNTRFVVDGGPAMTDLGLLTQSLGAAIGQTLISSKLAPLDGRFERFAKNVLGSNYSVVSKAKLKASLENTVKVLAQGQDTILVTEGFTRLDALNRIGNQVFAENMARPKNYSPIDAPVNYPHIWTTSWFNWVQYDGSIMQPLVRNAGEALGVAAFVDMDITQTIIDLPPTFDSSVPMNSLYQIEKWLGGTNPTNDLLVGEIGKFDGLSAPKWPDALPSIDTNLIEKGRALYTQHCQSCHLPPIDTVKFWDEHWDRIAYQNGDEIMLTDEKYLMLPLTPLDKIGTDPAQAQVLTERTVNTKALGLDTEVCIDTSKVQPDLQPSLQFVTVQDSPTSNFALALGAVVEETIQAWFKQNYTSEEDKLKLEGGRPNCLRLSNGYKARPLNGIWATAPFLHNGSIPNLYSLLSEPSARPTFVELGGLEFDPIKVGYVQSPYVQTLNQSNNHKPANQTEDYQNGLFILDTRQAGNKNQGHAYSDDASVKGRLGGAFSHEEKMALIAYLKTL